MDKSSKDQIVIQKANRIIEMNMPDFARRFFNDKMNSLKANSYYGYALDLREFFDYLGETSYTICSMKLSDLNRITPEVIEEYVEHLRTTLFNGKPKISSDQSLKRKLCVMSSFFNYYFQQGFIVFNPISKVEIPKVPAGPSKGSNMQDNLKLLEYVSKGNLPSSRRMKFQDKLRNRDTALLALIMGAGIKASECVALNIQDVDLKHNIITVESRRGPSQVCISQYLSETLGRYLAERLEMITLYGHDDAFFLSIQKKRISLRSIELLLKKYSSSLFGDEHSINPNEIRSAFKENVFTTSRNIFVTSELTGNAPASLLRQYFPYLEYYEAEKGKNFDPEKMQM